MSFYVSLVDFEIESFSGNLSDWSALNVNFIYLHSNESTQRKTMQMASTNGWRDMISGRSIASYFCASQITGLC